MFHQLAFSGVGSFNGGARTVLYSGKGALEDARAFKGAGTLLEDTLGGRLLNFVDENIAKLPQDVWKAASSAFTANAKGDVEVFLRNPEAGSIFNSVERPLADLINRVHSTLSGSPATTMVPR